jgi:hypothetical protein
MNIIRRDSDGGADQEIRVPLSYGPKDKKFVRNDADPEIQRETAIILPRISFELSNMEYDNDRKLGTTHRIVRKNDDDLNTFKRQYQPVPYNFHFDLFVYAKYFEDVTMITEQIFPFFTPSFTSTVNLIPEMDIQHDIPITLMSNSLEDTYDGQFEENRQIIWTMNFMLKGFMYGPIVNKPIIKLSNTNFYIGNTSTTNTIVERIKVTPGMDANGNPTSNSQNSIPAANIAVDDNWTYAVDYEDQND